MKKNISVNVVKNEDGTYKVAIEAVNLTPEDAHYLLGGLGGYAMDSGIAYTAPIIPELEDPELLERVATRLEELDNKEVEPLTLEDIMGSIRGIPGLGDKKIMIHPDFLDDLNKINKKPSN
jgi:hypothetical protein